MGFSSEYSFWVENDKTLHRRDKRGDQRRIVIGPEKAGKLDLHE
jgi:hypothetical protein